MLLQTLSTRDPDELAQGFRRWDLRFRQLGGGPFRGQLQFLQLGGTQILRAAGNRRLQAQGSLPPGSFGFAPVLPRNAGAIWRGRRCKTGQVVTIDPGQEGDHMSAAAYLMVGLTVDGDFFRECAAVLGGFDPDERLAGRLAVTSSPAGRRALTAHLRALLARAEARPDLLAQPRTRRAVEQECVRRLVAVIAESTGGDRTACWSSNRERLVRRAEDYMQGRPEGAPVPVRPVPGTGRERAGAALCVPAGPRPEPDGLFQGGSAQCGPSGAEGRSCGHDRAGDRPALGLPAHRGVRGGLPAAGRRAALPDA